MGGGAGGMLQQGRGEELENTHEVGEWFNSGLGGIHWWL